MKIRLVTPQDAPEIAAIYGAYVRETAISFESAPPSAEEMAARISELSGKLPWLVGEADGQILGYAYAGPYKSRCGYAWSVESTVYLRQGFQGQGIGTALYRKLLATVKAQGAVNVIAGIALPNAASVALHERLGFTKVAHFRDVGFKLGQWWDVGYWQLQFEKPAEPGPLRPLAPVWTAHTSE